MQIKVRGILVSHGWHLLNIFGFIISATLFIEKISGHHWQQVWHWLSKGVPPLFTLLIVAGVWLMLLATVGRLRVAAALSVMLLGGLSLVNAIKFSVRGQPLFPNEVLLFWEGLEVFRWERLPFNYFSGILYAFVLVVILFWAWSLPVQRLSWRRRLGVLLFGLLLLLGAIYYRRLPFVSSSLEYIDWNGADNFHENGFLLGFTMSAEVVLVSSPPGYSSAAITAIAQDLRMPSSTEISQDKPISLILILSESFFDLTRLPRLSFSSDPIPTFHHLASTFGHLDLISPIFGGGSCNAEFEMLTGGNMLFLPQESYPYMQFVHRATPSLANILRDRGYETYFLHPLDGSFYGIQAATAYLGFSGFHGVEQWSHTETSGYYISDASAMNELIDKINRLRHPFFVVLNTMEGHDPYTRGRYGKEESGVLGDHVKKMPAIESYTIAMRHADAALKMLIEHLKLIREPVLVVFFGDHLPRLSEDFSPGEGLYLQLGFSGDPRSSLDGYKVPAVFWTNTDRRIVLPRESMSMCYFSPLVLRLLGQPLPPFQLFLERLSQRFPILSKGGCTNSAGTSLPCRLVLQDPEVVKYRLLSYDMLFGNQYFWKRFEGTTITGGFAR